MIRLLIADDHAIVREGLKRVLARAPDLVVAAEAADGDEVMTLLRDSEHQFDVLVLDLSMPGRSGMELIELVKAERPRLRVLVLSMHQEARYAVRAIQSGASGYLTKDNPPDELVRAIRKIAAGGAWVMAEAAEQLALDAMQGTRKPAHGALSDRDFDVFRRLVAGSSVTQIATVLNLSSKTISAHKAHLMHKLGVTNRSELVRYSIRHGLSGDDT